MRHSEFYLSSALSLALCLLTTLPARGETKIKPFALPWTNHTTAGTTYFSLDTPGGVFVLESYFNTCPYCNDNAENVDELRAHYAAEPRVQVLDIGIDKAASDYSAWISKHKPNHPVLNDSAMVLTRQLGTKSYPTTYVMDCRGKILHKSTGVWDSARTQQLKTLIDAQLRKECFL